MSLPSVHPNSFPVLQLRKLSCRYMYMLITGTEYRCDSGDWGASTFIFSKRQRITRCLSSDRFQCRCDNVPNSINKTLAGPICLTPVDFLQTMTNIMTKYNNQIILDKLVKNNHVIFKYTNFCYKQSRIVILSSVSYNMYDMRAYMMYETVKHDYINTF